MLPRLGRAALIPAALDELTDTLARSGQPLALFSALYWRITEMIRQAPQLVDSAWIAQVQLNFYALFAQAWHKHQRAKLDPNDPWSLVFHANQAPTLGPAQHLLLGLNAHMCQDLIIALLMSELEHDMTSKKEAFFALNALFAQESAWLVERLSLVYQWPLTLEPFLASLTRAGMAFGRHESWTMAMTLRQWPPRAQQRYLKQRAQALKRLGALIMAAPLLGLSHDPDHAQTLLDDLRCAPALTPWPCPTLARSAHLAPAQGSSP